MNLAPVELNRQLASAVRYAASSERFYISGKARFYRLIGFGLVALGLGIAVGFGFYGYSLVTRNSENLSNFSEVLAKALSDVNFRTSADGAVQLQPRELTLSVGQTVSLDGSTRISLDPSATVRADGEIRIDSSAVTSSAGSASKPSVAAPSIVNFTVFKGVPFDKGSVQTGWIFLTSAQKSPTQQYCYYTEAADTPGRNYVLDIAVDRKLEAPQTQGSSFDLAAAFDKCVWFKGDASE